MHRFQVRAIFVATAAVLALAACGSSSKSSKPPAASPTSPTTAASPTTVAETTTAAAANAKATVSEAQNAKIGKAILVDSTGMTLYIWDKDPMGKATCTGVCAQAWPPDYVNGTPTYGMGLNAAMFSTVTGPNGQKQLAVNGKPLYHWINDKAAGDATGEGVNNFYVVGTNGQKIDKS
jgi:predicted lipoprotein with Yx(FWY)xxD motif